MPAEPQPLHDDMVDASHLISYTHTHTSEPLCTLEVKPRDQIKHVLGDYPLDAKLRGFSVEYEPEPELADDMVTQITCIRIGKKYRLHIHIANFGNKPIKVIVRQL